MSGLNQYFAAAWAIGGRQIRHLIVKPVIFLPSFVFPLLFFTAFAGGLSKVSDLPGFDFPANYTTFQYVFVLLQSATFVGMFTGFNIAADYEGGFARRLMLATPHRSAILLGFVINAMTRGVLNMTLITVVGLLAGAQITGTGVDLFGLYALGLLANLVGVLWGAGVAFRFRSLQASPIMFIPIFLIFFLAPTYVPLELLTGWIETAAHFNPITPLLETGRELVTGRPAAVLAAFGSAAGMIAVLLVWAFRGLRKAEAAG